MIYGKTDAQRRAEERVPKSKFAILPIELFSGRKAWLCRVWVVTLVVGHYFPSKRQFAFETREQAIQAASVKWER